MRDPASQTRPPKRKAQDSDAEDEHEDNADGDDQNASPTKRVRIWSAGVRPFSSPYGPPPLPHKTYSPIEENDDNDVYEQQRNSPPSSSLAGASPIRTWSGTTMVMGRRPTTSPPRRPPRRGICSSDGEDARPRGGGMMGAVGEAAVRFPTAYFFQGLGKAVEELMPFMGVGGGSWRSEGGMGGFGEVETETGAGMVVRAGREEEEGEDWEEEEEEEEDEDKCGCGTGERWK